MHPSEAARPVRTSKPELPAKRLPRPPASDGTADRRLGRLWWAVPSVLSGPAGVVRLAAQSGSGSLPDNAAWFCVALTAVLSLLPATEMARTGFSGKLEHAIAYAGTALLLCLRYRGPVRVAASLVTYAVALELLQAVSPGRTPALLDWLASSSGSLIGAVAAWAIIKFLPAARRLSSPSLRTQA